MMRKLYAGRQATDEHGKKSDLHPYSSVAEKVAMDGGRFDERDVGCAGVGRP